MEDLELTEVWQLVTDGQTYNNRVGYYKTVDDNEAYIRGDQWRGVKSNGLSTPVFNILKRVRDYKVSSIMSQKIKGNYSVETISSNSEIPEEQELLQLVQLMTNYVEVKWEKEKMDSMIRECVMDGFSSGDFCIYTYWDSTKKTGQNAKGNFCSEVTDGVNVLFGNPNNRIVEKQPYILILGRDMVKNLQKEAKNNGVSKAEYSKISGDDNTEYTAGTHGKIELDKSGGSAGKCSYAIKLWKEDGKVYYTKSTKYCVIKEKVDMLISCYPVAFGNWEHVKNSYHGQADCTGILPNQRYINKQFAMLMTWMTYNALGKVAYDSTRIPSYSTQIGVAIPVHGDTSGAIQQIPAGQFNAGVIELVTLAMKETMNAIGVNDVVLGDIRPDNTSAIIAIQKQSAVPLENVQANIYQFIEDIFLIWAEFIVAMYTTDRLLPQKNKDQIEYKNFNSEKLRDMLINVKIDVGASSMWSEITSLQTLDALLKGNYITMIQYLERLPNGIIPKKQDLIDELKQQMEQQKMIEEQALQGQEQDMQQMQDDEMKNQQYEKMAQFVESLPEEIQQQLQQLPPDEMEAAVMEYMQQNGQM